MINVQISEILDTYPKIALAVSGGSDSMAMLYWFITNRTSGSYLVVNIDHHIRGEESRKDSDFVEKYCSDNGVECIRYDIECVRYAQCNGYTIEQSARMQRHKIFRELCMDKVYAVATAHHADDQAESILMHIARGTGIDGLVGMNVVDGHLLRPFINTSKAEIMEYISANGVPYVEDSSNANSSYMRNFVRNEVFPMLEQRYPRIKQNLIKLSTRSREYQEFIDLYTPQLVMERNSVVLDISDKHRVIASEMIRRAFALLGIEADIEERHIELILSLLSERNSLALDMPYDTRVYNEGGRVVIEKVIDYTFRAIPMAEGMYDLPDGELVVEKVAEVQSDNADGEKVLYCDADKVVGAIIRVRKVGDKINKFGGGSKSLGDYLTDKKVPLRIRDRLPIVADIADTSRVFVVAGVDISADCKVDSDTKRIYKITYRHK